MEREVRGHAAPGLVARFAILCIALAWPSRTAAQDLFVVSQANQRVLRYDGSDGSFLEVFVQPITDGFRSLGGFAISPGDGKLYISSPSSGELWSYATATGTVITPAVTAEPIQPLGVAFDASGANLYFTDLATSDSDTVDTIKKLSISGGTVSTVLTDTSSNFLGLAVNGTSLFVTDTDNDRILRYPVSGGSGTEVITGLSSPSRILFLSSPSTRMLIADTGSDRVLEYVPSGENWVFNRVVLAETAGVDGPFGLALAPDGSLTVSGQFSDQVVSVDLTTTAVTTLVPAGAAGLDGPKDVAWNGGTLLVGSALNNRIIYFDAAGSPTGVQAQGTTTPADSGMAISPSGDRILVGSSVNNDLVEYDANTGGAIRTLFDACPSYFLASPFDVVYGPDGNIYVSCTGADAVHRFNGTTGNPLGYFVFPGSGGLSSPRGLLFGPAGNLLVASGFTGEVLEYDGTTGAYVGVFVDAAGNGGGLIDPYALRFKDGVLYVSSYFTNEVKTFDGTTGDFMTTFVSSGSGGLSGPTAMDFGPGGDLYVTSLNDDSVKRYNAGTGAFVESFIPSGGGGLDGPIDLEFRASQGAGGEGVPALSRRGIWLFMLFLIPWLLRNGRSPRRARPGAGGFS